MLLRQLIGSPLEEARAFFGGEADGWRGPLTVKFEAAQLRRYESKCSSTMRLTPFTRSSTLASPQSR